MSRHDASLESGVPEVPGGALPEGALVLERRFRVLRLLGNGGMGRVYLAEQVSLGRKVAVKVLRKELSLEPGMDERFRREALLLSSVDHPAVVRVIDFGQTNGATCLVMDLVEGETLEDAIRQGPLPPERALKVLYQLAQGLSAIHAQGIVHRDLKPENVMLARTPDGEQAKWLDFGIARLAGADGSKVTKVGVVIGTPDYMSPEQGLGQPLDARSDLYSFGAVAYRVLSGTRPFPGPSPRQFIVQHIQSTPRPLQDVAPGLAAYPELCALVMRCLAKEPGRRPATAQALALELARLCGGVTPVALPTHPPPPPLSAPASAPAAEIPARSGTDLVGVAPAQGSSPAAVSGHAGTRTLVRQALALLRGLGARQRIAWGGGAAALLIGVTASLLLWNAPERRARRLIQERRAPEALRILDRNGAAGQSPSFRMLRASALHSLGRHGEELDAIPELTAGDERVEPLLLEGLAEDFGHRESPAIRVALKRLPAEGVLPELQELAAGGSEKVRWGALRLVDLEYEGQGLPLVGLYSQALEPEDCRVRNLAARRLRELRHPDALPALQRLKETPKRLGLLLAEDCGQDQAAAAIRAIQRETNPP